MVYYIFPGIFTKKRESILTPWDDTSDLSRILSPCSVWRAILQCMSDLDAWHIFWRKTLRKLLLYITAIGAPSLDDGSNMWVSKRISSRWFSQSRYKMLSIPFHDCDCYVNCSNAKIISQNTYSNVSNVKISIHSIVSYPGQTFGKIINDILPLSFSFSFHSFLTCVALFWHDAI